MYLQAKTFRYSHKITQKLIAVIVADRTPLVYCVISIGLLSKKKGKQFVTNVFVIINLVKHADTLL